MGGDGEEGGDLGETAVEGAGPADGIDCGTGVISAVDGGGPIRVDGVTGLSGAKATAISVAPVDIAELISTVESFRKFECETPARKISGA